MTSHNFTVVEGAILSLSQGQRQVRVRLAELRERLPLFDRGLLDECLIRMQRENWLVLYREDRTQALTDDDHKGALIVGDCPRHLVLLEVPRKEHRR